MQELVLTGRPVHAASGWVPGSADACCLQKDGQPQRRHHPAAHPTWMTKVFPMMPPSPCALSSSRMAITVPRPVAASRPREPCRCTGCSGKQAHKAL